MTGKNAQNDGSPVILSRVCNANPVEVSKVWWTQHNNRQGTQRDSSSVVKSTDFRMTGGY